VASLDADNRLLELENGDRLRFDTAVLATGLRARLPGVEGEDLPGIFTLRNLSAAVAIKKYIRQMGVKSVVIVGAGFISFEMCEAFRTLGIPTTVLYRKELPMKGLGEEFARKLVDVIRDHDVRFVPHAEISGFERDGNGMLHILTEAGAFSADLVLIAVGALPETNMAKTAGVKLGETGAIAVNERMQTNYPFIYAAGDCCETFHRVLKRPFHLPLGDVANRQARVVGTNIGGGSGSFPGVIGSFCFKVFDTEVANTGITEAEAREEGIAAHAVTIWRGNKPAAYPGSEKIGLTLVAERGTGRVLGAQAVGGAGSVDRINALAVAVTGGLTLEDIGNLDLAYAPPFSNARDVIHIAAGELLKV
jgi:NADPH-dependent 2,4-dienoyl-CoA reductase/sulfur reductase-like enzyme